MFIKKLKNRIIDINELIDVIIITFIVSVLNK